MLGHVQTHAKRLVSSIPKVGEGSTPILKRHRRGAWKNAHEARELLVRTSKADDPVAELGGCAGACMMLAIARMDVDGDGSFDEEDLNSAQRLVDGTMNELLNAGVVAALILSIMFPLAYEENEALLELKLHAAEGWDWRHWSDLTSFLANQVAVCSAFMTVVLSSMMYTQISFWMPTLEAQLWYVVTSAHGQSLVTLTKQTTVYASLGTLALETAVTGTPLDFIAFAPIVAVGAATLYAHVTLSRACKAYLNEKLRVSDRSLD